MKTIYYLPFVLILLAPLRAHPQQRTEAVTKIHEVKWRSAEDLSSLIRGFASDFSVSQRFNTLTVTASEKDHEAIAALIRKYDVAARTIQFQFYLVKAGTAGEGIKDGLPERVEKVILEVAALTRYKTFELLDAPTLRTNEGKRASLSGKGQYFYSVGLEEGGGSIVTTQQGKRQIRVDAFVIRFSILVSEGGVDKPVFREVGVSTSFTIGDGETIVLGASQIQKETKDPGSAIITVVTAKILN